MKIFAFSGVKNEKVSLFQGWGQNEKIIQENGADTKYVKAQFPDRDADNNIGWVKRSYIKAASQCAKYKASLSVTEFAAVTNITVGSGLTDPNCCRFPLASSAKADYTQGQRQFGWRRGNGKRKHAASDLYHRDYEPVYA